MTPRDSSYRSDFFYSLFKEHSACTRGDILPQIVIKITEVHKLSDLASINSYFNINNYCPRVQRAWNLLSFGEWISNITSPSLLRVPLICYYRSIIYIAIALSLPVLLQQTLQLWFTVNLCKSTQGEHLVLSNLIAGSYIYSSFAFLCYFHFSFKMS